MSQWPPMPAWYTEYSPMRAVLLLSLSLLLVRAPLSAELSPQQTAALEAAATRELSARLIPGLSVAVASGDGEIWQAAWGFADLENHVPATPRAMYRLASISKPFTAVAALMLVEQGKLVLDAPVQRYVPSFPEKPQPVSLRDLLSHQSGIRHYRADNSDMNSTTHYWSVQQALSMFAADPLEFEPGTKYLYTSYGFNLAGAAVENAAGKPFDTAVRDMILEPSGIRTMQPDDVYRVIPHRVRGYRVRRDGTLENCALADTSNKLPGGGWLATASDLVRFSQALMNGRLLKPATMEEMWTARKLKDGKQTGYGLGWVIAKRGSLRVVSHSGGQQGANTFLLLVPEKKIAIAILANLEGAGANDIADRLLDVLLEPAQ